MSTAPGTIQHGYERNCRELERWLAAASDADLRRRSDGTRWTNEELLFHMVFGYMVVQALLPLVRIFGVLPAPFSRAFARILNAGTAPFDVVNYLGSKAAARYFNRRRMAAKLRRVTRSLERRMGHERARAMARGMSFPDRWDPFFTPWMSLADVYAYPIQHFDFHATQLSLGQGTGT
ncbi:DinB family protein [Arthrobacter sp. B10-11]|uniref:DinB family protein n=1 Tax=Arthrobacter sp. B10-11 TaxID=3081160 RepID=UPI002953DCD0|nr:DinB family protein [Arthrobacter sp. B10-11]MDV8147987.1 DinB family protein [Arthrobacter sp. B10-11]